ncbi:efflux RND transporter permease subunit [Pseudaminobacter arsenicus]|uniref:Efflux RND transporter permease subunit n=1 Tax=Borborobacter arsenicus TaxID=1851146 RepID=A0A432UZP7_9HYPH|nr:efflux RND transporter permease subunit [Pseudaminobacter arsenicus]RUM95409.1 efflux RND transporter permease subunit [Pseudaminobacter arsenicus]
MFNWIIDWSLRNRLIVLIFYGLLAVAAIVVIPRMAIDVFPEFAPPQVQLQTEAPGFSAQDVELLVTRPIEAALQGMPNVDQIRSTSSVGLSRIVVVFETDVDVYRARVIAQERLQLVQSRLPAGVDAPQLMPLTSAISWLVKFALVDWSQNPDPLALRSLVDWEFRNRLLAQPGVAEVVASGGGVKQYQVLVDPLRLKSYGIPFSSVVAAAEQVNSVAPGAFVYPSADEEYFVRANGLVDGLQDIADTIVTSRDGVPVRISDVGEVKLGEEIKRGDAMMFGGDAIIATVSKQWGADTVETTQRIEVVLAEMAKSLPPDVQLVSNVFRQASSIERSMDNLRSALLESTAIVALVLILLLARWRPTVISLVAIPASLIIGILFLWLGGIGINALTLGGLIFAIGEVVDDSIIDVENILRRLREHRQSGATTPVISVVYEGSREIRNSVVFATLIVAAAFMPIFFLSDIEGRIFAPMAIAYLAAVVGSLFVALSLVPVLCYYGLARSSARSDHSMGRVARSLQRRYQALLTLSMGHTKLMLAIGVVGIVLSAGLLLSLGRSFMPALSEGNVVIATTMMPGTSLEENIRVGRRIEEILSTIPEIATVGQRAGRSRLDEDAQPVNFSEFDVTLLPEVQDPQRVLHEIRQRLSGIPGVAINVSQFITHRMQEILSGVRSQVVVKIYGPDFDELTEKQTEVMNAVQDLAGITDLQAEPMVRIPGLDIRVNRQAAGLYGFSPGEIVRQVGQAFNGVAVSRVLEADRTYDLVVRVAEANRKNIDEMREFPLQTAQGTTVPLRQVAELASSLEPYQINRDNGTRRAVVQWNVEGNDLNQTIHAAQEAITAKVKLAPGYSIEFGGDYVGQQRATYNLVLSGTATLVIIFALLLLAFKSLPHALLVMANIPFALVGGALALALAGETLNVASTIGLIALLGVAARNSILLISRYDTLTGISADEDARALAVHGATDRMLPILMTALTTCLAVIPLLIGDPVGKEFQRAVALTLFGGMISSTLLNLFLVPTIYASMVRRWPAQKSQGLAKRNQVLPELLS